MPHTCPQCGKSCRRVSQHIRWAHSPRTSSKPFKLFTKGGSRITVVSRVAPGEVDSAYTCPGMGCMRRFKFHVALFVHWRAGCWSGWPGEEELESDSDYSGDEDSDAAVYQGPRRRSKRIKRLKRLAKRDAERQTVEVYSVAESDSDVEIIHTIPVAAAVPRTAVSMSAGSSSSQLSAPGSDQPTNHFVTQFLRELSPRFVKYTRLFIEIGLCEEDSFRLAAGVADQVAKKLEESGVPWLDAQIIERAIRVNNARRGI